MYGLVRDVLADKGREVFAVGPRTTVRQAVQRMNEHGIGAVLVLEGERPIGIFTERDVLRRVVDAGRDPDTTLVQEVMSSPVVTVRPDTPVREAMETITTLRHRHLPVVDGGKVVGLVSIGDLLRWVTYYQQREIEHMTDYITGRAPA
ncbi:MAG: CBS domain-containing protein [Chloroflexota bacterium]|nr:CBS domain-containing protein [Dehalococcoidia bacterium]MDW8045970.1 CBS domain-containing protein [Chloroflexota bacterium]